MASAKIATLLIRTLAKPISNQLKNQAKEHETFRTFCVSLAQRMYRTEVRLRTNLLGEPPKHVRPLSETKAIENGANALAEGFLFGVAALAIIGESWRSSRKESKRRGNVDDQLEELQTRVQQLSEKVDTVTTGFAEVQQRNDELTRILEHIVEIGLRGGWAEFENTPLALPRIQLAPSRACLSPPSPDATPNVQGIAPQTGTDQSANSRTN
ncbi:OPA3-domain-containing protein [Obba rivulosa]|uniref:OPA3-domain-containing protein n=1 Tax=Obba rivulosa TaxID=1052685 RepID=A0A8E2AVN1_9APHY|nr:OPA3-domain-containing protein [Obba rivulosa]